VGGGHSRIKRNVAAQIEAICNVVGVTFYFGLAWVTLAPIPLLLKLLRERIRVFNALDVDPRAGITVPVPRAANVTADFETSHGKARFSRAVDHVETSETGSHYDHVYLQPVSIYRHIELGFL
jgi:hypothetical protein